MQGDARYWIALSLVNGLGDVLIKNLYSRFRGAGEVFRASEGELLSVEGISEKTAEGIRTFNDWSRVETQLSKAEMLGYEFLPYGGPLYPRTLINIYNPPPFLFMKGDLLPGDEISIAIVGSRVPDRYGRLVTEALAGELASLGVTIVSGMARGIDSIAQQEALKRGGRTIGVLGCGLDVVYPPENVKLHAAIPQSGALLSEFLIGTPPVAGHFPRRNRIISGLSLGVVVVQASDKSGSLITASFALDQNKEVFAVPGNVDRKLSRGPNRIIKKGAKLVETVDDILIEIEALRNLGGGPVRDQDEITAGLSKEEKAVYSVLGTEPLHIDEVIRVTGLDTSSVLSLLLSLELEGLVAQLPGKFYRTKL